MLPPSTSRSAVPSHVRKWRPVALLALLALGACAEAPTEPVAQVTPTPAYDLIPQVFTSGSQVTTWDPIIPAAPYANWPTTVCTNTPLVGRNANWQNPHNAYVLSGHPWAYDYFYAPWINAWNYLASVGPGGHNWTKYQTQVSGNGTFVIRLLADNCSWIYLDGTLVGVQNTNLAANSYGLTLNGTHTLEFIIFDGGGAAGGKYILETTSNPPPPLNPDLDGDGHNNDADAFPLNPAEWADSDGDGVGDNADAFPNDPAETVDTDGDGHGDNGDAFPTNASEWADTDGDGHGDNSDAFPTNPSEWIDSDGDGIGNNADAFDNSNKGPTVVIGTCNTGVANKHLGNGSWFNDLIGAAKSGSANHGAFLSAVASLTDGWKKAGLISGRDEGAITSCAARTK